MSGLQDTLDKLAATDFDGLIGLAECAWLDAKESPYQLDTPKQKLELAKDVTALANAIGGIIVIGFDTERHPTTAAEQISKVCPFPLHLVNADRYGKILSSLVHPPLDVKVLLFANPAGDGRGVAVLAVEGARDQPYLVGSMLDETDQSIGAYFGYFERRQDVIPPTNIARIQQQLAAGQKWTSIEQRLAAIEAVMSGWGKAAPPTKNVGITDQERQKRLKAARIASGRDEAPIAFYTATPVGECDFPTLFASRSERIVRLIENPPQLRPQGFEIWADKSSTIIQGKLRRNVIPGTRLIEMWRDGLFIFIAQGDEDFLGWRTHGFDKPIHISNFVLAESILTFCWLMKFIYEEANPKPSAIRLSVGFDNLTRSSGPATLTDVPEGKMRIGAKAQAAPAAGVEVFQLADLASYDEEHIAFLLMADIYNWFGFDAMNVPYVDPSGPKPKLKGTFLIGSPLPDTVATPDYY
jgi:hypothetical protein